MLAAAIVGCEVALAGCVVALAGSAVPAGSAFAAANMPILQSLRSPRPGLQSPLEFDNDSLEAMPRTADAAAIAPLPMPQHPWVSYGGYQVQWTHVETLAIAAQLKARMPTEITEKVNSGIWTGSKCFRITPSNAMIRHHGLALNRDWLAPVLEISPHRRFARGFLADVLRDLDEMY